MGTVVKTRRAETIEACERVAEMTGIEIIAHMPRMVEFYRKRANEQLRAGRAASDAQVIADAKAKLDLVRWAESWTSWPIDSWPGQDTEQARNVSYAMSGNLSMIGYALRKLVQAYVDHPQFRPEWLSSPD